MDNFFTVIHVTSMAGMSYICWNYGYVFKNIINISPFKQYKDKINFEENKWITEDIFCNLSSSFTGMLIGRMLWPVTLPLSMLYIEKRHGEAIRNFIRDISKSK